MAELIDRIEDFGKSSFVRMQYLFIDRDIQFDCEYLEDGMRMVCQRPLLKRPDYLFGSVKQVNADRLGNITCYEFWEDSERIDYRGVAELFFLAVIGASSLFSLITICLSIGKPRDVAYWCEHHAMGFAALALTLVLLLACFRMSDTFSLLSRKHLEARGYAIFAFVGCGYGVIFSVALLYVFIAVIWSGHVPWVHTGQMPW